MTDLKILAVDDSPAMRRIIINTLRRAGFEDVTEATDGKDALAKLRENEFNLVITDWNMSETDGLAFVISLRKSEKLRRIPVLMVTTRSIKEDILEAMTAGVNNYIVKPLTPQRLRDKIVQTLESVS